MDDLRCYFKDTVRYTIVGLKKYMNEDKETPYIFGEINFSPIFSGIWLTATPDTGDWRIAEDLPSKLFFRQLML